VLRSPAVEFSESSSSYSVIPYLHSVSTPTRIDLGPLYLGQRRHHPGCRQPAHDVVLHHIRDVNARNIGRKTRATKGRRFYWPTACAVRHRHYRTPLSLEPRSQQTRQTPVRTFHEQTQSSRTAHQETQKLPLVLRSNRPTPLIQATLRVP